MPRNKKGRNQKENQDISSYLDRLQNESWNLELIISGLALFGLAAAYQYVISLDYIGELTSESYIGGLMLAGMLILYFSGMIVFVNLIIHFLLRGLWIGAVGLRSVSGDINFYQLRLSRPFSKFLRRRISSFDQYIVGLDRICSVIFSFSFLLALLIIGFFSFLGVFALLTYGLKELNDYVGTDFFGIILPAIFILYGLLGLLYLIDFLTLGWVKRIRWLSKLYYPVYRFFGFVTFARIYRPLYYNFIDDVFGRRMVLLAIPYILTLFLVISMGFTGGPFYDENYFEDQELFDGHFTKERYYENLRKSEDGLPGCLLLSDVVHEPINKLSIYILPEYTEVIEYKYPDAKRLNKNVLASEFVVGFNRHENHLDSEDGKAADDLITYFKSIFELRLNGELLSMKDAVLFETKKQPFPKLVKYIPLSGVSPGLQQLEVTRFDYSSRGDSLKPIKLTLPFYYQPE